MTTKKIQNIAIISMIVLGIWFIALAYADSSKSDDKDSKQIADLEYRMNELRKEKEKCFNNLTYEESKQAYLGFIKPCVGWDEQIMELREKADALKTKSYEGLR